MFSFSENVCFNEIVLPTLVEYIEHVFLCVNKGYCTGDKDDIF